MCNKYLFSWYMLFLEQISYHQSGRPIFYVDDSCPCLGGGIMFYTRCNDKTYFLLQQEEGNHKYVFCDLGGKTDISDSNIIETAVREVMEETNGVLFQQLLKPSCHHLFCMNSKFEDYMANLYRLFQDHPPHFIYSSKSKYLIVLVEIDAKYISKQVLPKHNDKILSLKNQFGSMELKNTLQRQIVWMDLDNFRSLLKDKKMHIRLKDTKVYQYIDVLRYQS